MNIEETIKDAGLPVNSKAMVARLLELLDENKTNCLSNCRDDVRIRSILWLMMQQVFGQLTIIDMEELWRKLVNEI